MLVLDSGGVSRLAEPSQQVAALILALRAEDPVLTSDPGDLGALAQHANDVLVEKV